MSEPLLFVYGTLRPGYDGPMADWLKHVAHHVGGATARGALYHVDGYPAFLVGEADVVRGDLFALPDPAAILSVLDEHEECSCHFLHPQEYRRERLTVQSAAGPVEAWTYIYNRDVGALRRIASGDFLA